jgi:hypothetical protein
MRILLATIFFSVLVSGCTTPVDADRGVAPFYIERSEQLAGGIVRESEHFWPFFSHSKTPNSEEIRVLYPFFRDRVEERVRETWIIPLYHRMAYTHVDGSEDIDGFLLPFFLWGFDDEEGNYFAFAPLGGTIKGILGKDRIDFVLFPLWARLRDRDQVSTYWLFPFVEIEEGPLRQGLRVFPFYSRSRGFTSDGKLRDESTYILWPFWHQTRTQLDTDNPTISRWLWPFYGKIESKSRIARTILYPLWTEEHDSRSETSSWSLLPWTIGKRQGEWTRLEFYPIWGRHDRPGLSSGFFLWPIWQWEDQQAAGRRREVRRLFPIWRSITDEDPERGKRSNYLLWPLARWETDASGRKTGSAPAILPFDDQDGISWSHSRAWQILRWRQEQDYWGLELLWGLLTAESGTEQGGFSVLGGLLSRERGVRQDDSRWRLLYISL